MSFFDIVSWAQMAENVCESVQKGTRVLVSGRLEQRSWETDNGDKRSKVEVIADEIAPSLRWATATVVKNERSGGFDGGGGEQRQVVAARASAPEPPADYGSDEEPF